MFDDMSVLNSIILPTFFFMLFVPARGVCEQPSTAKVSHAAEYCCSHQFLQLLRSALGCHGLGLLFRVCDSDEVAVVELGDGVAGGADLGVDLLRGRVFRVLKRGKSKKREREFFCFSFVCSFSSPLSLSPFFFVTKRIINGPGGRGGWPGGRSC